MDSSYPQQPPGRRPPPAPPPAGPFPAGMTPPTPSGRPRRTGSGLPDDRPRAGWKDPLISPARYVGTALLLVVATAHLLIIEDQFERATYLGLLFVLISTAAVVVGGLLAWRDTRLTWLAAGLTAELGVAVYLLGRTVGLPEMSDDIGRWTQPIGLLSVITETTVVVLTGWAISVNRPAQRWASSRLPLVSGLVALQIGGAATFAAASIPEAAPPPDLHGMVHAASTDTSQYWGAVGGAPFHPTGKTRTYYLAADEVVWDYAPTGRNQITGQPFDETADTYVRSGPGRIGSTYLKCLYRGYTDGSFTTPRQLPADQAYLGMWGPLIRAAVGDTIKVVFRNNCRIGASVHPHGVFYQKASEGAPYADNTSGADKQDDAVPRGGSHTYTWLVPDRAGPGPHDGSSVMWMYHSHTDEVGDTYAGLMGPMVITSAAMARADGSPKDVDREVFELYTVENENKSPYLRANLQRFAKRPFASPEDEDFQESNLMHSINGYVFGNQPMPTMRKGQRVRWYLMSMGTEVDLHTPHWHGNDVTVGGMRMDVVSLLPAGMVVADMVPDNVGIWLFHCHVNDHLTAGMISRYQVLP